MNFFNNRCFEPSRPDKKELLDRLGLDAYMCYNKVDTLKVLE